MCDVLFFHFLSVYMLLGYHINIFYIVLVVEFKIYILELMYFMLNNNKKIKIIIYKCVFENLFIE